MTTSFFGVHLPAESVTARASFATVTMARDAETGEDIPAPPAQQRNPHLVAFAKRAGVTMEDVRKHGPREVVVLANLRELCDATDARDRGDH